MSAPPPINNNLRIGGFCAWAGLLGILAMVDLSSVQKPILWSITLALVSLTLEAFLLFKVAYYLPATTWRTKKWQEFFYESRKGSMALLTLCVLWLLNLLSMLVMVFLDLALAGPISAALGKIYRRGGMLLFLADGIYIFIVFDFLFLIAWVFWTGAKAMWRVSAPIDRQGEYEAGLGLMVGQNEN